MGGCVMAEKTSLVQQPCSSPAAGAGLSHSFFSRNCSAENCGLGNCCFMLQA